MSDQVVGRPAAASHGSQQPAWRRLTAAEQRWPTAVAIAVAIALQLVLPDRLILEPRWALPGVEIALLAALTAVNPLRLTRTHPALRLGGLALVATVTAANAASAVLLVDRLLHGRGGSSAAALIGSGAAIYATNIIAFGLWYRELDRSGPGARARGDHERPLPEVLPAVGGRLTARPAS